MTGFYRRKSTFVRITRGIFLQGSDSGGGVAACLSPTPDDKAQRRKRGQPKHGQWLRDCGQGNHITNTVIHQAAVKTAAGRTTKNI